MKIVYIFSSIAKIAGTERILADKMNYLVDIPNYEVYLITYEQGIHPFSFSLSSKIKHIDLGTRFLAIYKSNRFIRFFKYLQLKQLFKKKLLKTIKEITPEIILCTTYSDMEIKVISKLPQNNIRIIESHISKNHTGYCYKFRDNKILLSCAKLNDYITSKALDKFDALVTLTQGDALLWRKPDKVHVIPNIISKYPDIDSNCMSKRVITVGRLCEQKGFDLLIDAWKEVHDSHPEWLLSIYGKGEDKEKLLTIIKQYHLNNVITINEPTPDIYRYYQESSIYVMSSRYEGFGLVLIEAMSCGIPCVSYDCPFGPSEIIKDKADGLLVKEMSSHALANKICYLIEHDEIRQQMGLTAKENVKRFLPINIMPQWEKLFQTLIEKRESVDLHKNN